MPSGTEMRSAARSAGDGHSQIRRAWPQGLQEMMPACEINQSQRFPTGFPSDTTGPTSQRLPMEAREVRGPSVQTQGPGRAGVCLHQHPSPLGFRRTGQGWGFCLFRTIEVICIYYREFGKSRKARGRNRKYSESYSTLLRSSIFHHIDLISTHCSLIHVSFH